MMMMMMMIMGMKALSQHLALLLPSLILPSVPPSHSSFLVPCPGGAGSPLNHFHLFLNAHFSFSFSFSFLPLSRSLLRPGLYNPRTPVFPGHHRSGKPRTAIFRFFSSFFLFSHCLRFRSLLCAFHCGSSCSHANRFIHTSCLRKFS